MGDTARDVTILRELAKRTLEEASQDRQNERRVLWADFNSLRTCRVPVYILDPQAITREVFKDGDIQCEDPLFRSYEYWFRLQLYHATFGDDYITEPWIPVRPVYANENPHWQTWGIDVTYQRIQESMAYRIADPVIRNREDLSRLMLPLGVPDEEKTRNRLDRMRDAVGDILPVIPDAYPPGVFSLSYVLGYLLGPGQMLYQLCDQPELVHALCRILSDGFIQIMDRAEKLGWLTNCNNTFIGNAEIQAMAYCHELPSPGPVRTVSMKEHWVYDCAQEFESVSPAMHNEFLLEYLLPYYRKFGLVAYGCCENLTRKISILQRIPNLRRVAVTPWADNEQCAQQLTDRYGISWRPNPAEMITTGFDPDRIRRIVRQAKETFERYHCHWEVNLKDFLSVEHDVHRLRNWVSVVREVLD